MTPYEATSSKALIYSFCFPRTNLPSETMAFPDFPFTPEVEGSFPRHEEVLSYLERYASHYNLNQYLTLGATVKSVQKVQNTWKIEVELSASDGSKSVEISECDVVFVCAGIFSFPRYPTDIGLEHFRGTSLHSHMYRYPEPFAGQRVVILGSGPSGIDIAIEVAKFADKVFLCHNKEELESELPTNMEECKSIATIKENQSIQLTNGQCLNDVDAIIVCTGYTYRFPFIDADTVGISIDPISGVSPLYHHLVFIEDPSLLFVGLTKQQSPFPNFDAQARYCLWTLANPGAISKEEMYGWLADDEAWRRTESPAIKERHVLSPQHWAHYAELSRIAGSPVLMWPSRQRMFDAARAHRSRHLLSFRGDTWRARDAAVFEHHGDVSSSSSRHTGYPLRFAN